MNLLFVSPEFETTFWSWKYLLKFVGKKAAFMPLALITAAAMFPQIWSKRLIDLNVRSSKSMWRTVWEALLMVFGVKPKRVAELITDEEFAWAEMIVISGMIGQGKSIKELISRCKKLGKRVALGGSILELEEMCNEFPGVSHFFLGKGERTVRHFVADLKSGKAKRIYAAKDYGFPFISESATPMYELIDHRVYSAGAVQDSWACPHRCTYCNDRVLDGFEWQQKTPDRFLAELDALWRTGFRGAIQVFSANFIGNIPKAKALLRKLVAWQVAHGYPFEFTVEASILVARDAELMALMVNANIKKVFLGLETNDPDCLKEAEKWQNLKCDLVADVARIWQAGLVPISGYMVGFDNEKATFADRMIAFIHDTCVIAMVGTVQAQPGTALYERVKSRFLDRARSNTAYRPNFETVMPVRDLVRGFVRILEETHQSPRRYYERIRSCIRKYGVDKRPRKRLGYADIKALMRANLWIGLLGGVRVSYYFWKSLLVTFFSKKRRAFPDVVAFWIYQVHIKKTTLKEIKMAKAFLASCE